MYNVSRFTHNDARLEGAIAYRCWLTCNVMGIVNRCESIVYRFACYNGESQIPSLPPISQPKDW